LAVRGKDPVQLLWWWSWRVGRRQRGCARGHRAVAHEALEPCRRAQHEHSRHMAIHTERMRYSHRHDRGCASLELKAQVASPNGQPTLKHEVAFILGMGMKRRR